MREKLRLVWLAGLLKPGASLAQQARRQQVRFKGGRLASFAGWVQTKTSMIFGRSQYSFLWLLTVGLVGMYLVPSEIPLYWWRIELSLFDSTTEAAEFIRTLWQVQASVLALSIAVIIFAFQAVPSSRYGIKLYEFAQDTRLFPVFYWGVAGLIVAGMVLLGFGNGGPAGSAGLWAVLVSGSSLPLVAWVFSNTVRALDPEQLHYHRLSRLREEVDRAVEQEIFERIAFSLLETRCEEVGIRLRIFLSSSPSPDAKVVNAPQTGRVRDIDLAKLESLTDSRQTREEDPSGVELRTYLGTRVKEGQGILFLPPSATDEMMRKAQKVVRLEVEERQRPDVLAEATERLHEEALEAIRIGSPARYEDVLDAYEAALMAFPEAWQRYGQRFDSQVARGLNPLGISQTEGFLQNLRVELSEAAVSNAREIALAAARVPTSIARKAFASNAIALSERALGLSNIVYQVTCASANEVTQAVRKNIWLSLYHFASYPLISQIRARDSVPEERLKAGEFLRQVFGTYNSLMQSMLELKDLETLREIDVSWSEVLRYWRPEDKQPFQEQADILRRSSREVPSQQEMRHQEEIERQRIPSKQEFLDLQITYRYGLCFWALRRLRLADAPEEWVQLFKYLRSHFSEVEQIVGGANRAFANEEEMPWSDWILFDISGPTGGGGAVGADGEILRVLATLLLLSIDLETQAPFVGPLEWLPVRLDGAERLLDEVSQDDVLEKYLSPERPFLERTETVRELLKRSARLQNKLQNQEIRDSAVSPEKVENFKSDVCKAWLENRLAVPLFQLSNSYDEIDEASSGDEDWFIFHTWAPKSLLLPDREVLGDDSVPYEIGFQLANLEIQELLARLFSSSREENVSGATVERIRGALRSMTEEGFQPSVILTPTFFEFLRGVEFDATVLSDGSSPLDSISERAPYQFLGRIEGIPVFSLLHVPDDRVYIVDFASFATWRQWRINANGDQLSVEIEVFEEEQALNLAREQSNLFRTTELQSAEDRAAEIRTHVHIRAREHFELQIDDRRAAQWVNILEETT